MNTYGTQRRSQGLLLIALAACAACTQSDDHDFRSGALAAVSSGREVSLEYTLRLEDDTVYSTNVGADPLIYTHGRGQLLAGLEGALEGLGIGARTEVTVLPAEGYGESNPLHISEVPKEFIPPDARRVGTQLHTTARHGQVIQMEVREVKKETIVMDFNHPLAGKTLHFEVTIIDVK